MAHFCFVSFEVAPTTAGGVGVFIQAITERLAADGHRVTLILDLPNGDFQHWCTVGVRTFDSAGNVRSFRVDDLCIDIKRRRQEFPSDAHWQSYRFAQAVAAVHAREEIDFVEFVDYCGAAYYTLAGRALCSVRFPKRVAIRLHNTIEIIHRRVNVAPETYRSYDFALEHAAISLADVVLTPGKNYWEQEARSLYPVPVERVQASFPVRRALQRKRVSEGSDILFVGRQSEFKGMDRFLHAGIALCALPEVAKNIGRLVVVGPDESVAKSGRIHDLVRIAKQRIGDRLQFTGRLNEEQILSLYDRAALAVFPARMESFCYAAHEAHMANVPLVLSDIPAFRDHFVDGQSALFFDNTVPDLVRAIRQLLQDTALRSKLSDSCDLHRERYTQHSYNTHLSVPAYSAEATGNGSNTTFIAFDTQPKRRAAGWISDLHKEAPHLEILHLVPSTDTTDLRAFGRCWHVCDSVGRPVVPQLHPTRQCVLFAEVQRIPNVQFIFESERAILSESRIGAVLPSLARSHLDRRIDERAILPHQFLTMRETSIVGAVLRNSARRSLNDLCEDGEATTELNLILKTSAAGLVLIDHPDSGIDTSDGRSIFRTNASSICLSHAWGHDSFQLACALDTLQRSQAIVTRRLNHAEDTWTRRAISQTRANKRLLIARVAKGADKASVGSYVSVLSVRRGFDLIEDLEDAFSFEGDWERVERNDWAEPLLRTRGGGFRIEPADHASIEFLVGPDQGKVQLAHNGRILELDLSADAHNAIAVTIQSLFGQFSSSTSRSPLRLVEQHQVRPFRAALQQALRDGLESLGLSFDQEREKAHLPSPTRTLILPAGSDQFVEELAKVIVEEVRSAARPLRLHIRESLWSTPLVRALCAGRPHIEVWFEIHNAIDWKLGGLERCQQLFQLHQQWGGHLAYYAFEGSTQEVLSQLGLDVRLIAAPLPPPSTRAKPGPVHLVLPRPPASLPTLGHLVAAVYLAVRAAPKEFGAIYIPSEETHSGQVLHALGIADRVRKYDRVERLFSEVEGQRFIYCCVFPDNYLYREIVAAQSSGGVSLVANGGAHHCAKAAKVLQIQYWEDARDICDRLRRIAAEYDHYSDCNSRQCRDCLSVQNQQRRVSDAASEMAD